MISQSILFIWRGMGIANVSPNYVHVYDQYAVWWILGSVPLPLVIEPKILKEALSSGMEIWAGSASGKSRSYVNQTEQANWTYSGIYFTLVKVNATFVPRTRLLACKGVGHSGAGPSKFFVLLPNFFVSRKICLKHIIQTKILSPKNVFSPQTLKPDYVPAKNDWLGESC